MAAKKDTQPEHKETYPTPLYCILMEMQKVAMGGAAVDLHRVVAQLCPDTPNAATQYVEMLMRLRQAAEAAYNTASAEAAQVQSRT